MKNFSLTTYHTPFTEKRATVIGQITHDHCEKIRPGGCAYFAVKTLQNLGADVSLVSSVGQDFKFEHELDGIRRIMDIGNHTTTFANVYPTEGPGIQYVTHQAPAISPAILPAEWRTSDLMILAPVMGELNETSWRSVFGTNHTALFLQGYLKRAHTQFRNGKRLVIPRHDPFPWELLQHVDSVFVSREDIELFASSAFLARLIDTVSIVAVTDGESGCRIHFNDTCVDVGVFPVDTKDPTGAGDTFGAATAMALASGFPVEAAGRLGAAAASLVVEGHGSERLKKMNFAWERQHLISSRESRCDTDRLVG